MRAVLQRVSSASVTIGGDTKAVIGPGLLVLLAVTPTDTPDDIAWLSGKLVRLRVFNDEAGVMNRSIQEAGGDFLVVSQFTLYASTRKGNRPSWSRAAPPETAIPLYESFLRQLANDFGRPVQSGEFGTDMKVALVNDGPVTVLIDSQLRE
jgi:D-tyrosyl-tRNA(Tyr) deacylase